ncbi:MAG TPA: VOC family protein [Hyphomicrobium sp.]|nr:VOC family protein [Hyphomicrobium sp.]
MGAELNPPPILETVLYAGDLAAAESFYSRLLGVTPYAKVEGRHVFFKLESQMLLIFNPDATRKPGTGALPVPAHGADGQGHVCFSAAPDGIDAWRSRVADMGLSVEADFEWPNGGHSIYVRDPAGNSVEFAEPRIWGLGA